MGLLNPSSPARRWRSPACPWSSTRCACAASRPRVAERPAGGRPPLRGVVIPQTAASRTSRHLPRPAAALRDLDLAEAPGDGTRRTCRPRVASSAAWGLRLRHRRRSALPRRLPPVRSGAGVAAPRALPSRTTPARTTSPTFVEVPAAAAAVRRASAWRAPRPGPNRAAARPGSLFAPSAADGSLHGDLGGDRPPAALPAPSRSGSRG